MDLSFLTMTFLRDMAIAPLDRQTVTIIGSISGVSPTATASPKRSAASQSCLVRPTIRKTAATMIAMKRIMSQTNPRIPRSKLVSSLRSVRWTEISPRKVSKPVLTTSARPAPLTTVLPWNTAFGRSRGSPPSRAGAGAGAGFFSIGMDSPVSADWLTNRSLAWMMRASAGMIEPAARTTMSPGTMSDRGISISFPSRMTMDSARTMRCRASAARLERRSWT